MMENFRIALRTPKAQPQKEGRYERDKSTPLEHICHFMLSHHKPGAHQGRLDRRHKESINPK